MTATIHSANGRSERKQLSDQLVRQRTLISYGGMQQRIALVNRLRA